MFNLIPILKRYAHKNIYIYYINIPKITIQKNHLNLSLNLIYI